MAFYLNEGSAIGFVTDVDQILHFDRQWPHHRLIDSKPNKLG